MPIPKDISHSWYLVDAEGLVAGRSASRIARRLRGKDDPRFTAHVSPNVHVVVTNASKLELTGKKRKEGIFYYHTGKARGIRKEVYGETLDGKYPERLLQRMVKGMMTNNRLCRKILKNLHVYGGPEHPHAAQNPQKWDLSENKRSK